MTIVSSSTRLLGALLSLLLAVQLRPAMAQQAPLPGPELDSLATLLLQSSGALGSRRAALGVAESSIGAATARDPATLRVDVENIPSGTAIDRSQQVIVGVEALLLRGPGPGAARTEAAAARDLSMAGLVLAEQQVIAHLRRGVAGYAAARLADARLAEMDALLADAEVSLRARFGVGDARYVDVLRLRTARVNLGLERAARQAAGQGHLEAVVGLYGTDSTRAAARGLVERLHVVGTLEALSAIAPASDSALLAQWSQVLALRADALVRSARARRGTTLTGFLGVQRFADIDGSLVVGPTLGVTMPLAFTTGGSTSSLVAQAEARRTAVLAEASARRVALEAERRRAQVRLDAARARARAVDDALLQGARAERDAALAAFRSGELSLVELLDFERALAQADLGRLDALNDAADASATLDQLPADQLLELVAALGGQ